MIMATRSVVRGIWLDPVHVIEEYARHTGYVDLRRECNDGRTRPLAAADQRWIGAVGAGPW